MSEIILTKEGLEKVQKELQELKEAKRPYVRDRIKKAKEFGDLSENAEYEDARNEQSFIEGRIQELEEMLKNAKIIESKKNASIISVGDIVTIDCEGEKSTYELVGATESDPLAGKISVESPIGRSLLGKGKGHIIKTQTPGGEVECKILEIK